MTTTAQSTIPTQGHPTGHLEHAAHEAAIALDDAWAEYNRLRTRLLAEIPAAYREAAEQGNAPAMTRLAEEAAALPVAITSAELVARRLAVVSSVAQLQVTDVRQQAQRPGAEEARETHQRMLSTATRAEYLKGIPKPQALLAYEQATLAHGQAQQEAHEAPLLLAAAIERALLGLPTVR